MFRRRYETVKVEVEGPVTDQYVVRDGDVYREVQYGSSRTKLVRIGKLNPNNTVTLQVTRKVRVPSDHEVARDNRENKK